MERPTRTADNRQPVEPTWTDVGKMRPGDEVPAGSPNSGEQMCQRCGGSGRAAQGNACETCRGTGRVTVMLGDA